MGLWVNKKSYTAGSRHYFDDDVTLNHSESAINKPGQITFVDQMSGPALCGATLQNKGSIYRPVGAKGYRYGGLSAIENVNLLQRNLCGYCVKRFMKTRPELAVIYDQLKGAKLPSA